MEAPEHTRAAIVAAVQSWHPDPHVLRWEVGDVISYALAVGATPPDELSLVWEGAGPTVLPTFATWFGTRPMADLFALLPRPPRRSLASSMEVVTHTTSIPAACARALVSSSARVVDERDDQVIVMVSSTTVSTTPTRHDLATLHSAVHFRLPSPGPRTAGPRIEPVVPTIICREAIGRHQAPLFRVQHDLRHDRVRADQIHIDPVSSRRAGLPGPILHGECTLGIVCRAALRHLVGGDASVIAGLSAVFVGRVAVDDELTIAFGARADDEVRYHASDGHGRVAVQGSITLR